MTVVDDIDMMDEDRRGGGSFRKVFGVLFDPRTYGAIVYMLLALPLGIAYFTFVTVGLSLSIGLMILIIGVFIAIAFFAMARGISLVEGFITGALLGAKIPHRDADVAEDISEFAESDGEDEQESKSRLWPATKRMFTDLRTYSSMIYMALMMPLGVGYFTIAVTGFVTSIAFMLAPFGSLISDHVTVMDVSVDEPETLIQLSEFANSPVGLIVVALVGFALFFTMLHLSRGIGWLHARLAEKMLIKRSLDIVIPGGKRPG